MIIHQTSRSEGCPFKKKKTQQQQRNFSFMHSRVLFCLVSQVPSFARRSNILADLQEASLDDGDDSCQKSGPIQMLRPQAQQYQLNSKKHHQYQPLCREREAEQQANGKKFYYQLNSKKHHHYQPDLQAHEHVFAKPRDVKAPELSNKGYNLPPVLQQKWVRDKDSGCLTKVRDITMELKKLPADLNGHKEGEKPKPKEDAPPQANGVSSSKLKIVKNKNKNGRIVIVMSKYMENGMQTDKIKNGDSEAGEKQAHGTDGGVERHLEKMKLVKKLGLKNGFANQPEDKTRVFCSGFNADYPKEKERAPPVEATVTEQEEVRSQGALPADHPSHLTSKPNLLSLPPERGAPPSLDKRGNQGGTQGLKRHLSDAGGEELDGSKRFFSCRSVSAPAAVSSPPQSTGCSQNGHQSPAAPQGCAYADQEEPMDLSMVKSRPRSPAGAAAQPVPPPGPPPARDESQTRTDAQTETQAQSDADRPAEDRSDSASVSVPEKKKEETFPSFQPFLGNIVITDITANCLTVTFKEYIAT